MRILNGMRATKQEDRQRTPVAGFPPGPAVAALPVHLLFPGVLLTPPA
jgi:hypothetical protein